MYIFLTIVIVIVAILLIGIVLIQNSKGGGLASGFASGNQVMGAPRTADVLEKASWWFVSIIAVLSILAVGINKGQRSQDNAGSAIVEQVEEAASAMPQAAPAAPQVADETEGTEEGE